MVAEIFDESLNSRAKVKGLTHNYYNYPARFPPEFVRESILNFSKPGDYVLDAFMGGGTTIVEALAHGRNPIGFDISPLAYFITKVKTTPLSERDKSAILDWADQISLENIPNIDEQAPELRNVPYEQKNTLVYLSEELWKLNLPRQRDFAKCVLLRLGQWMLDCRTTLPSNDRIQAEFGKLVTIMLDSLEEFVSVSKESGVPKNRITNKRKIFVGSIDNLTENKHFADCKKKIKLVLTSPPYPGVHVLYHRWQVNSRKETAAPFWLAGLKDGHGEAYYTLGGRTKKGKIEYFARLSKLFKSIKEHIADDALVIQLVAFSDVERQLPEFLMALSDAGYCETFPVRDARITRIVPHRKWYATLNEVDKQQAGVEMAFFHRVK